MKSIEGVNSVERYTKAKVWSSILQQVRLTDTKKLPSNRSLVVLGDNDTGKATLMAKLAGLGAPKKGSGLEYNFIEIRDEYRDDSTKLGAWILNGDPWHTNLLSFALNESNFEHSCCILVASMSQPWNIMRSLERWATILEHHIETLDIEPSKIKQARRKLLDKFINYVSPADEADSKLVAGINRSEMNISSTDRGGPDEAKDDEFFDTSNDAIALGDLGKNIFTKNLGIEIVVVITKTDYMSTLEKDYDYTEENFDFMQQAIRKFCLRFGASLFYVSTKINRNCDLLHKYLAHKMYDLPFKESVSVVEKDAIFVPAGWDNETKISILYDNIRNYSPDDDYNSVILERSNPGPAQREVEIEVESDQDFLLRMQGDLGKQVQPSIGPSSTPSPVQPRQNLNNSMDAQPSGEGVLQNFFNSLLSKGRTVPSPGQSSGGQPEQ